MICAQEFVWNSQIIYIIIIIKHLIHFKEYI